MPNGVNCASKLLNASIRHVSCRTFATIKTIKVKGEVMSVQQTFEFLTSQDVTYSNTAENSSVSLTEETASNSQRTGRNSSVRQQSWFSSIASEATHRESVAKETAVHKKTPAEAQAQLPDIVSATDPPNPNAADQRAKVLNDLRAKVGCLSATDEPQIAEELLSTGSTAIDRLMPSGGMRIPTITEWVAHSDACGASTLSLVAVANRMKQQPIGSLLVVSDDQHFYPPSAAALGIEMSRVIWVRPRTMAEIVWSVDQSLRCAEVAAVWAPIPAGLDDRDARRFQLAAETGQTPGFFVRPRSVRGRPTFADVRFHAGHALLDASASERHSQSGHATSTDSSTPVWRVTLDRCRGTSGGQHVDVTMNHEGLLETCRNPLQRNSTKQTPPAVSVSPDESSAVRLASELAHPTATNPARRRHA